MTWVRLSDTFADEPRWETLGAEAMALHVAALCYCNRNLTDGVLPRSRAERLLAASNSPAIVDALITAGLWIDNNNGDVEIVNYLNEQPSREKVEAERERWRLSKQMSRKSPRGTPARSPNVPSRKGRARKTRTVRGTDPWGKPYEYEEDIEPDYDT